MADELALEVNGRTSTVAVSPETPLLYVLMNDLALRGPRFGCGLAQCGACSVLVDGVEYPFVRHSDVSRRREIGHDARRVAPAYYASSGLMSRSLRQSETDTVGCALGGVT